MKPSQLGHCRFSPVISSEFHSPAGRACCCSQTGSVCTSDGNLERIAEFGWLTGSVRGQAVGESLKYQTVSFGSGAGAGPRVIEISSAAIVRMTSR